MKKILGYKKELVMDGQESEKFEDELEAMTTTTTRSRTISLISSQRSSSLMKMTDSELSRQIPLSSFRSKSLRK